MTAAVKAGLFRSGWYAHRLAQDALPGVLVLCYHGIRSPKWQAGEPAFSHLHVPLSTFEAQCRVVAETCHPISLADWRAATAGLGALPPRPVVVTFDDGYRSVHDLALPVLTRLHIPAAVFACSDPIATGRLFWYDAMARAGGETAVSEYLRSAMERGDFISPPAPVAAADDPLAPLTIDQLKALADAGVEIGAHTATHANLSASNAGRQREELATCRDALERWLGGRVRALSYPWGRRRTDYSDETIGIARDLAFDMAFTTEPAFATRGAPVFERPRFLAMWDLGPAELAHRIAYAWR
jgi:peptidoglycan/xylan/chitin deacetylase (PgdA/CDA1 family)